MLRFLSHIFGWNYESCKGCEILKIQLDIANNENKELLHTLLQLIRPQIIEQPVKELQPLPSNPAAMSFSRRRAELEKSERSRNQIIKTSPFLASPDDLVSPSKTNKDNNKSPIGLGISAESLEKELNISQEGASNA